MNKYLIFLSMVFTSAYAKAQDNHADLVKSQTAVYVLKYYYEEQPDKILYTVATARQVDKLKSFCLVNFDQSDLKKVTYRSCFDALAVPTGSGNDKEFTKIGKGNIKLNFKGRDTTVLMHTELLKNTTNLWFWKNNPKLNETVVVNTIKKNFITNTIDQVAVSYTYLGKEKIKIMDKVNSYHLVKMTPLNGSSGVYDLRWYDNKGMVVKEKHVVGKDGARIAMLTKIVKN